MHSTTTIENRAKNHQNILLELLGFEIVFLSELLNIIGKIPKDMEQINSPIEVVIWSL